MIHTALLGCGSMGRLRAAAVAGDARFRLVAVADVDVARADALAQRYGATSAPPATLAAMGVDLLIIATPTPLHAAALPPGSNPRFVFCETPLAPGLAAGQTLIDACATADAGLIPGSYRFWPDLVGLRLAAASGALGAPGMIRLALHCAAPQGAGGWYGEAANGRALLDMAPGLLDYAAHVMGPLRSVFAQRRASDVDVTLATLRFVDGRLGHLDMGWTLPPGCEPALAGEIAGTRGVSMTRNDESAAIRVWPAGSVRSDYEPNAPVWRRAPAVPDPLAAEMAAVADLIGGRGGGVLPTPDDALQALAGLEALRRSVAEKRPVALEEV